MRHHEGHYQGHGLRIAIVVSRFNSTITERLLEGALDALKRHGVADSDITVARVPGAFEIPVVAKTLALTHAYDAIIALGAIIRGATAHFDYVAGPVASALQSIALETSIPTLFGILTTDTIEQAIERSGTKAGNKGFDVALSAIETSSLLKGLAAP